LPYLLALERVEDGTGSNNLIKLITSFLKENGGLSKENGGLSKEDIQAKLLYFGTDGASVFQGNRNGVTTQLVREFAPNLLGSHCCVHRLNLVVQSLAETDIVSQMEALLTTLYAYFAKLPKKALEFSNLAEVMETRGRKILKHCRTRWVGMLAPAKRILSKYRLLVAKMAANYNSHAPTCSLYYLLVDVKCLLSMAAIVHLFEKVESLMKFVQNRDVFVCDFVARMKALQLQLQHLYVNDGTRFGGDDFSLLTGIIETSAQSILLNWMPDMNLDGLEYLCFESNKVSWHLYVTLHNPVTGKHEQVIQHSFVDTVEVVKQTCTGK
jgi:hypothetical protein